MDWIFDHLRFVIIAGFVIASLVKRFSDAKNAEAEERRAREEMAGDDSPFGQAEVWQQPQAPPAPSVPPPLTRKVTIPPRKSDPPPLREDFSEIDAVLKRQLEMQERLQQIKQTKATTTGDAAATRARVSAVGKPAMPFMPGKTSLRESLRDAKQTRRAIVLREILGPPVGMR